MGSSLAALLILLAAPPRVEFATFLEGSDEHVPAQALERLTSATGAHITDCKAEGAVWLEYDLGGPKGPETIVATFRDGVGVFGPTGALYSRHVDDGLRCGESASVRLLAVVRLPAAPPAVLFLVRDDTGEGREIEERARLLVFDGLKLKLAWERTFKAGERFDGSALKWDRKKRRFR